MATTKKEGVLTYIDNVGDTTELYPNTATDTTLSISGKPADAAAVGTELTSLKKSVSDGRTLVANAITAKGIETATDESFENMATNISSIVTDDETKYQSQLYTSLRYSGLVTSTTTFANMCTKLSAYFPATKSLITSGWIFFNSTSDSDVSGSGSCNTSAVTLRGPNRGSDTEGNAYVTYDSPEFDITAFKTLTLYGSSYKVTGNTSSTVYLPKVYLVNSTNNAQTQLYQHGSTAGRSTTTINLTYNCASLRGNYRIRLYSFAYTDYESGNYVQLTKALLSC